MRRILLVITKPPEPLDDVVAGIQRNLPGHEVVVADLTAEPADYQRLVEQIFAADSVQVW